FQDAVSISVDHLPPPALFLNPTFVLHLINTFMSHLVPPPLTQSNSLHPVFEGFGPVPGSAPYIDVHANNRLCWKFTGVIVVVQFLAFTWVSENREQRKARRAARLEKERAKKSKGVKFEDEKTSILTDGGYMDGACDFLDDGIRTAANGNGFGASHSKKFDTEGEETSMAETSEDDLF
ncbi:hypothetical protein LSUE1_G009515, partial [Lachnellula suecica]